MSRARFAEMPVEGSEEGVRMLFPTRASPLHPQYREGPEEGRAFTRRLRGYLREAGIADREKPFHQLRHTFATTLLMEGWRPYWVAKWMDHADTYILRRYSHWIPPDDEHAPVDRLGEIFAHDRTKGAQSREPEGSGTGK